MPSDCGLYLGVGLAPWRFMSTFPGRNCCAREQVVQTVATTPCLFLHVLNGGGWNTPINQLHCRVALRGPKPAQPQANIDEKRMTETTVPTYIPKLSIWGQLWSPLQMPRRERGTGTELVCSAVLATHRGDWWGSLQLPPCSQTHTSQGWPALGDGERVPALLSQPKFPVTFSTRSVRKWRNLFLQCTAALRFCYFQLYVLPLSPGNCQRRTPIFKSMLRKKWRRRRSWAGLTKSSSGSCKREMLWAPWNSHPHRPHLFIAARQGTPLRQKSEPCGDDSALACHKSPAFYAFPIC